MKRAAATFKKQGIDVLPYPVDFDTRGRITPAGLGFLPDAAALAKTTTALKEYLGHLYYWLCGRL